LPPPCRGPKARGAASGVDQRRIDLLRQWGRGGLFNLAGQAGRHESITGARQGFDMVAQIERPQRFTQPVDQLRQIELVHERCTLSPDRAHQLFSCAQGGCMFHHET